MTPASRSVLAVLALCTLPLAGCGSSDSDSEDVTTKANGFADQSGTKIMEAALTAMEDVDAVHIEGNMILDDGRIDLDVRKDEAGTCAGEMRQGKGTATFIATAKGDYLKGNEAFWRDAGGGDPSQVLGLLDGKWARLPDADEFEGLCDISQLLSTAEGDFDGIEVGGVSSFGGDEVVELTQKDGKESYRILVATDAPHHLVLLVSETEGDNGKLTFSDFEKVKPVDVPSSDEYVEIG